MFCLELIISSWILLSVNFRGVLGTLTVAPQNVAVEIGSTVYLTCNADDSPKKWTISNLNPSNAVSCSASGSTTTCAPADTDISIITIGATQKDLSITNVQTTDAGTYTCQDAATPRSAELYVMTKPMCGGGVTVTDGSPSTVTLTCTLNYVGKFEATLEMTGGTGTLPTPTENYVQFTSKAVTYAVPSPTATTTYTCKVTLKLGAIATNAASNEPKYTETCTQVVSVVTTAPTTTTTTLAPGVTTTPAATVTTGNSTNVTAGSSTSGFNMTYIIAIIAGVVGLGMLIALLCCIYLVSTSSSRASALPTMTRNAYSASPKRQGYYREGRGSFEPEEPRERKKSMLSRVLSRGDKTYFD